MLPLPPLMPPPLLPKRPRLLQSPLSDLMGLSGFWPGHEESRPRAAFFVGCPGRALRTVTPT
jgi:hypothetical protein